MADELAGYRWAWALRVSPEEKLVALALADGELEPRLDAIASRTGLPFRTTQIAATRLHERGLIDDNLHPIHSTSEDSPDGQPA